MKTWHVWTFAVASGLVITYLALVASKHEKQLCVKRWEQSLTIAKYQDGVGCLVQKSPGNWVPEAFMKGAK